MTEMSDNSEFDFERRDPHGFLENSAEAIWGDRNLAAIRKYFATDMVSRSPMRVFENRESLINEAMSDLAEFPDLQMLSEDVINCDTGLEKALDPGLFSAQRMTLKASHIGDGQYGQATGKAVQFRVMSDRWYSSEKLYDEWLVRDTAAILRQLDQQPEDWARRILQDMGPEAVAPLTPDRDIEGPYGGLRSGAAWGDELAALLKQLMAGEIGAATRRYDPACEVAYSGGLNFMGHSAVERHWVALRMAFPTAAFRIEHRLGAEAPHSAPRASVRWSLYGKHDGPGLFGDPTGCYVYVFGITQAEFGPKGLRREYSLIDEAAIWLQILQAKGAF